MSYENPPGTDPFGQDSYFDIYNLISVIGQQTCAWVPDMTSDWGMDYTSDGPSSLHSTWIAPATGLLPLCLRQMMSWNREQYQDWYSFYDFHASMGVKLFPRSLVPISIRIKPMLIPSTPLKYKDMMTSRNQANDLYENCDAKLSDVTVSICSQGRFPSFLTDRYTIDISWGPDEFTNRMGIRYAKVEIEPSIRLESIHGANMGIIPLDANGNADINTIKKNINPVSTGFPSREAVLMCKITYPWVRLNGQWPSIVEAGPIGKWSLNASPVAGTTQDGLYLGCVNDRAFLGFPKGRVLYQSADLVEKVSPISGRLGYQITHVFQILPASSWNMVRYQGDMTVSLAKAGGVTEWPRGYIVALDNTGNIYKTPAVPPLIETVLYPYSHRNFNKLLYYGIVGDGLMPRDEG